MKRPADTGVRVLHLDHTIEKGGAEFALLRILLASHSWDASLSLPRQRSDGAGVYEPLVSTAGVDLLFSGPAQQYGASSGGLFSSVVFAARAFGQSFSLIGSNAFRESDLIHANTSRSAVYGALASWIAKKPLIVHLRDSVDATSMGRAGFILFTKFALRVAGGVIANSQSTLDSALPYLSPRVLRAVIPSAAGILEGTSEADSIVSGEVRTVGMLARIDPWKGQDLLLRAFARQFAKTPTRLVLAGGAAFGHTDFRDRLIVLAEQLGIADQVDFLGHVNDVGSLLSQFDVCVQASRRPEPLGQNVLQYLAAGKVTIATRQGGPGEWINDQKNGLLFEMNDVDSLSDALGRVALDRNLRMKLAAGARATPGLRSDAEIASEHGEFFRRCLAVVPSRRQLTLVESASNAN